MAKTTYVLFIEAEPTPRLVEAASRNAAIAHVAASLIRCEVATKESMYKAARQGVEIEVAGVVPVLTEQVVEAVRERSSPLFQVSELEAVEG